MVRTMRQPPIMVPSPMAEKLAITTHAGTRNSPVICPVANSSAVMMPTVFWASLPPWPRLKAAAEISWSLRNNRSTK